MKLDPSALRFLTNEDFRALTAVEIGQRNHEIVPVTLISSIAKLRHGGIEKLLSNLCRHKLLHHESRPFHGYRLTNMGYDYLALKTFLSRGNVSGVGRQIGVGKESDIFVVTNGEEELCLKVHRLGRTSFRAIKSKRDYHRGRGSPSWLYLSRLAATKEFEFMKTLAENDFPVPQPVDSNRHCLLMSLVDGFPLNQVKDLEKKEEMYIKLMDLVKRFAQYGLIHGDFNEFNIMVTKDGNIVVIDFPQMVSIQHPNARMYFERDVNCISRYFRKRFGFVLDYRPMFDEISENLVKRLDQIVMASGFTKSMAKELDAFILNECDSDEETDDETNMNTTSSLSAENPENHTSNELEIKERQSKSSGLQNNVNNIGKNQGIKLKSQNEGAGRELPYGNDSPDACLAYDYETELERGSMSTGITIADIRRKVRREKTRAKGKKTNHVKQSRNIVKNRDKRALRHMILDS